MVLEIATGLLDLLVSIILNVISTTGYWGVFFLMLLESAVMPVPSEIIMPFAGYLVWLGKLDLTWVVAAGTVGNLTGSWLAYVVGYYVGRPAIVRYGRFVLLKESHLELAEKWFKKYGDKAIFFSRLLPVVRTVISLPAGIGKMNFKKFSVYTILGSAPWVFAWAYIGVVLGEKWEMLEGYMQWVKVAVVLVLIVVAVWFVWSHRKNSKHYAKHTKK